MCKFSVTTGEIATSGEYRRAMRVQYRLMIACTWLVIAATEAVILLRT
jgi:hypothetical protein